MKQIIELHGGVMKVDSSPAGSTFTMLLPICGPPADPLALIRQPADRGAVGRRGRSADPADLIVLGRQREAPQMVETFGLLVGGGARRPYGGGRKGRELPDASVGELERRNRDEMLRPAGDEPVVLGSVGDVGAALDQADGDDLGPAVAGGESEPADRDPADVGVDRGGECPERGNEGGEGGDTDDDAGHAAAPAASPELHACAMATPPGGEEDRGNGR